MWRKGVSALCAISAGVALGKYRRDGRPMISGCIGAMQTSPTDHESNEIKPQKITSAAVSLERETKMCTNMKDMNIAINSEKEQEDINEQELVPSASTSRQVDDMRSEACGTVLSDTNSYTIVVTPKNISIPQSLNEVGIVHPIKSLKDGQVVTTDPVVSDRILMIARYGTPTLKTELQYYNNFILSYDQTKRVAHWVLEHLNKELVTRDESQFGRKKSNFYEDDKLDPSFRATNEDYKAYSYIYDQGHQAAAMNHPTEHKYDTFVLTNICPQDKFMNKGVWRTIEKHCRGKALNGDNVWLCSGPLFSPKEDLDGSIRVNYPVLGPNYIAVPTDFFKVMVYETNGKLHLESYKVENKKPESETALNDLKLYQWGIDNIERVLGYRLFPLLERNDLRKMNHKPQNETTKSKTKVFNSNTVPTQ